MKLLKLYRILIVSGGTGSGKTTQLPQYYAEVFEHLGLMIVCTQPNAVAAEQASIHVSYEFDELKKNYVQCLTGCVSNKMKQDLMKNRPKILYCTEFALIELLRDEKLDFLQYCGAIMLDEAHTRTINTDVLLNLKNQIGDYKTKLIISSATLNVNKHKEYFEEVFDDVKTIDVKGSKYNIEIFHEDFNLSSFYSTFNSIYDAVFQKIELLSTEKTGDILVFLPDAAVSKDVYERALEEGQEDVFFTLLSEYSTQKQQDEALDGCPMDYSMKVIFTYSFGETSFTIVGVEIVIDCGLTERKTYNPDTRSIERKSCPITKSSATQRAGRCGRTGEGKCYRLYPEDFKFSKEIPEIQRTSLNSLCLILLRAGVPDVYQFGFMDSPPEGALKSSENELKTFGLIETDEKGQTITRKGEYCANFETNPLYSMCFMEAEKIGCLQQVCYIIAAIENSVLCQICSKSQDQKLYADGDHMKLYKLILIYKSVECGRKDCTGRNCKGCIHARIKYFAQKFAGVDEKAVYALKNVIAAGDVSNKIAKELRIQYFNKQFKKPSLEKMLIRIYRRSNEDFTKRINAMWSTIGPVLLKGMFQFIAIGRNLSKDISTTDKIEHCTTPQGQYQLFSSKPPVNINITRFSMIYRKPKNSLLPGIILVSHLRTADGSRSAYVASAISGKNYLDACPEKHRQNSKRFLKSSIKTIVVNNVGPGIWERLKWKEIGLTIERKYDTMISWEEKTCVLTCTCRKNAEAVKKAITDELKIAENELLSRTMQIDVGVTRVQFGAGMEIRSLPQEDQCYEISFANLPYCTLKWTVERYVESKIGKGCVSYVMSYPIPLRSYYVKNNFNGKHRTFCSKKVVFHRSEDAQKCMKLNGEHVCLTHGLMCKKINDLRCTKAPLHLTRNLRTVKIDKRIAKVVECVKMEGNEQIDRSTLYLMLGQLKADSISMIVDPTVKNVKNYLFTIRMMFENEKDAKNTKYIFNAGDGCSGCAGFTQVRDDPSEKVPIPQTTDKSNTGEPASDGIYRVCSTDLLSKAKNIRENDAYIESNNSRPEIVVSPTHIFIKSQSHRRAIRCQFLKILAPYSICMNRFFVSCLKQNSMEQDIVKKCNNKVYIQIEESSPYVRIYGSAKGNAAKELRLKEKEFLKTHFRTTFSLPKGHNRKLVAEILSMLGNHPEWKAFPTNVDNDPLMNVVALSGNERNVKKRLEMLAHAFSEYSCNDEEDEKKNDEDCPMCCQSNPTIPLQLCGHSYCLSCWKRLFSSSQREKRCPVPDCNKKALVGEAHLMSENVFVQKFNGYIQNNDLFMCQTDGCLNFFHATQDERTDKPFTRYCYYCESTSQFQSGFTENEKKSVEWIKKNYSTCPKCKEGIERESKCNHMTHKGVCNFQYCYVCEGDWSSHKKVYSTCNIYPYSLKNQVPLKRK